MSSYYRIIKRIHDEWERNFVKFVESLKRKGFASFFLARRQEETTIC